MPRPPSKLWARQTKPDEAASIGFRLAQRAEKDNEPRRLACRKYGSMYEGQDLPGLDGDCFYGDTPLVFDGAPLVNNRDRSIVQTLRSKLAALDEPRPQFVVTDGTYEQKRQAVWLDRFVEGIYYQPQMQGMYKSLWEMWRQAFLIAAAATGTVAMKIFPDFNTRRITIEINNTMGMWVDPFEVRYGGPITYGDSTWMDGERLLEQYKRAPKKVDAILSALDNPPQRASAGQSRLEDTQQVLVHELWRVRTHPDQPGKYLMCVGATALEFEDYEYETPPFAFYHYDRRLGGFWSSSATQPLYESVKRENQVQYRMDESEARSGTIILPYDPNVQGSDKVLAGGRMNVIPVPYDASRGNPPAPIVVPWYPQQAVELMRIHAQNAHDVSGVSAMQTTGQAQTGLTAAVAIRTVLSLLNERLAPQQRDIVQAIAVDSAQLIARAGRELYERFGSFDSRWYGKSFVRKIPGKDCLGLPNEIFTCQPRPVSEKKNSPEDRIQLAQELVSQGVITGGHWLGILQHMDTMGAMKQFEIVEEWCEWQFDRWLYAPDSDLDKPGFYVSPPKNMDLDYAMAITVDQLLRAQIDGVPDERRQLILKFLGDLNRKIDQRDQRRAALGLDPKPPAMPGGAPAPVEGQAAALA